MTDAGVRVTFDDDRVPAGQRGATGKLLLLTNDANEPRMEIAVRARRSGGPSPAALNVERGRRWRRSRAYPWRAG